MMNWLKPGVLVSLFVFSGGAAMADLPEMKAEYVGKARFLWEDQEVDATLRAKGEMLRMDVAADQLDMATGTSVIMDFTENRFISFATGNVPPDMRYYMSVTDSSIRPANDEAVAVGTERVAGLTCTNYEFIEQTPTGEIATYRNCISSKGIWLKSVDGDEKTIFEMMDVQMKPQPASLFQPPAGYSELDLGGMGGFDLSAFGGGDMGYPTDQPSVYQTEETGKVDQITDETRDQVEDRVDQERREAVDNILGRIFGN